MSPPDVNAIAETSRASMSRTTPASQTNPSSQQPSPGESRRASAVMGPPPIPHSSQPNSPRLVNASMTDSTGFTGPIRHPRPLTAAELHLELEKEQESIVNRLTRELSALRTQTASVASTTSSTSDLFTSQTLPEYPYATSFQGTGASIIPTSARRHRSSSNLSNRSARSARDGVSSATATSVSGVAAPRDRDAGHGTGTSGRQSLDIARPETSRQNSYNLGHSNSYTSNPGMYPGSSYRSTSASSPYTPNASFSHSHSHGHGHRPSLGSTTAQSRDASQGAGLTPSTSNQGLGIVSGSTHRSPSFSSAQAAARYEEAATQRQELEAIKRENEALKQRIKELERALAGDVPAPQSVVATT